MRESLHSKIILRAADIKGGAVPLAQALEVPLCVVQAWMRADVPLPPWVFFALVDIIYDDQLRNIKDERRTSAGAAHHAGS